MQEEEMSHHQSTESKIKEADQEGGRRDDRKEADAQKTMFSSKEIHLNCSVQSP